MEDNSQLGMTNCDPSFVTISQKSSTIFCFALSFGRVELRATGYRGQFLGADSKV